MLPCDRLINPIFPNAHSACMQINTSIDVALNEPIKAIAVSTLGLITVGSAGSNIAQTSTAVSFLSRGQFTMSFLQSLSAALGALGTYGTALLTLGATQSTFDTFPPHEFFDNINTRAGAVMIGKQGAMTNAVNAVLTLCRGEFVISFIHSLNVVFNNLFIHWVITTRSVESVKLVFTNTTKPLGHMCSRNGVNLR
jgi:hypothetical protein